MPACCIVWNFDSAESNVGTIVTGVVDADLHVEDGVVAVAQAPAVERGHAGLAVDFSGELTRSRDRADATLGVVLVSDRWVRFKLLGLFMDPRFVYEERGLLTRLWPV